ncbi:MAG TPA: carboxypeptidase-like regulatory domain-containing protein [Planctomycetota bacterium]|nr:carboxypeptidase-like regulatory domain-containing protein [Planctomycetota bacterium]
MNRPAKLIVLLVVAALALAGFLLWQSNRATPDVAPVRIPDPPAQPAGVKPETAQQPDQGRVEAPTQAPAGDTSPGAIAVGRVRGQVDTVPGAKFPAQFELVVETAGSPSRVLVIPGTERLVTLDLEPGRSVLSARAEGLASRLLVLERKSDAPVPPFKLTLEPAGRLNGQVLDPRGAALAGLPVFLVATSSKDVRTTASDSEGRYTFSDAPVGSYCVAFGASDSPIAPVVPVDVVQTEVREVPPQSMPELGEGEIRVLDRESKPVEGARVFGAGQSGGWIDGVSNSAGYVHARFLPAGNFFLNVTTEDGRSGQGPLEINLGRIGRSMIHIRN